MNKGFTLIELLVVLAIIAALAGFAIANFGSTEKATQLASMKGDMRTAITQMQIAKINDADFSLIAGTAKKKEVAATVAAQEALVFTGASTQVSPNNKLTIVSAATFGADGTIADDATCDYSILIESEKADKKVIYNKCSTNGDVAPRAVAK